MARLVNLTPHPVRVLKENGELVMELPPEGIVPRCAEEVEPYTEVNGIPVVRKRLGAVEGLPAPEDSVYYVVSRAVAEAARGRDDLLIPDDLVRDEKGRVIGCRRFAVVG